MNKRKKYEAFELMDTVLGDYYIATTKHDVYNSVNRLKVDDSFGVFLQNKEGTKAELTVYYANEDAFDVFFEETSSDDNGKNLRLEGLSERKFYDFLNSLFLDFYVINPTIVTESFEGFDFQETITEESQKDTEKEVKRIIQNCCKGKAREILPKKWAIDRDTVVLVFWHNYFESKKVMNLCNKIEDMLQDELGMEISVCADSTAHLNWHNI